MKITGRLYVWLLQALHLSSWMVVEQLIHVSKFLFLSRKILLAISQKNSLLSEVLKRIGIIIWDEVRMQHKFAVEALDHTLQDVLKNKKPFGGNFHQTLPVVQRGSRHQILDASLRNSRL